MMNWPWAQVAMVQMVPKIHKKIYLVQTLWERGNKQTVKD